jgi:hypothetical protein
VATKSQVFWLMPEQVLAPTVPGQPPLSAGGQQGQAVVASEARTC